MGKATFQQSKDDVLAWAAAQIGAERAQLGRAA
jgi:hypothetical protein